MFKQKLISIVIPVFNEKERLSNLYEIYRYLQKKRFLYEIMVVDDGSNSESSENLKKINKDIPFKLIRYVRNMGKGYAVKKGILKAKGDYILFTDIDLSVPIKELDKFIKETQLNPVVIGSRQEKGSRIILPQSRIREFMGQTFTWLSQFVLGVAVSDFTCGFKCFQKKAGKEIFRKETINRWGFDSEIMLIAKRLNYEIFELPVQWSHNNQTKVSFPKDIIRSFIELIKIKNNDLKGIYSKRQDLLTS